AIILGEATLRMRLLLHTNVDELSSHRTALSSEPISIEIRQTEVDRIAQSTEIFISNNFNLSGPPKYQDSDGDFVIMDNAESYKAAVSDLLAAGKSTMIVLIDGSYKYENVASTDNSTDSTDSSSMRKATAISEERRMLSKILDSVMEKVRNEIRTEVKRELDARLPSLFTSDICHHCTNVASMSCTCCSRKEAVAEKETDCKLDGVEDIKQSDSHHGDRSWSNNGELREVFGTTAKVEETGRSSIGKVVMESEHDVTSLVDSFATNEFDKSASAAVAGVPKEGEENSKTKESISSPSTQTKDKERCSEAYHLLVKGEEISGRNSLEEKLQLECDHFKDSQLISDNNISSASSMSTVVIGLKSSKSELKKLDDTTINNIEKCPDFLNESQSSKISIEKTRTDRSIYEITGSLYTSDNIDCLTADRSCDSSSIYQSNDYNAMRFICVHADCNYAELKLDEIFSHDPHHTIIKPAIDMRVEDLASLRENFLSKSSAASAHLSPPTFIRLTNRLLPESNGLLDAEIEHEGEVALMTEIDENKGTFWKQWTIRNSGTMKWKNVTLELVSHTPNLDPFFCSISLPNSLQVGRSLDAVVWMNAPLDAKPCRAVWRLAMSRDPSAQHSRFFGPPLIFQMGVLSSAGDEMETMINDDGSESAVSTILDSDFDVVDGESLSHIGSEDV
uniref:Next to BRCA1 central domain-containing protein n=1 Tax=Parascaris univalens TaxID=6257 RepID=A0A915AAE7_PARUN